MDIYMIILRLIHIIAGVFWVGSGAFAVLFVSPTARRLGPDGIKYMQTLIRTPGYTFFFPAMSLLTTVAGLLLYYEVSDGFNSDWMELDSSIVLSIGALAGMLAFGHGGATLGRASGKMMKFANEIDAQGGPPSDEQLAKIKETSAYMELHQRISFGLMMISLMGMASARYF